MTCQVCRELIHEIQFNHFVGRDRDHAALCEECGDAGIHLRCFTRPQLREFYEKLYWECAPCLEGQSSELYSESESEESDEEVSDSDEEEEESKNEVAS